MEMVDWFCYWDCNKHSSFRCSRYGCINCRDRSWALHAEISPQNKCSGLRPCTCPQTAVERLILFVKHSFTTCLGPREVDCSKEVRRALRNVNKFSPGQEKDLFSQKLEIYPSKLFNVELNSFYLGNYLVEKCTSIQGFPVFLVTKQSGALF